MKAVKGFSVRGDAKALHAVVSVAASLVPSKSPRPALQHLLLEARGGVVTVTGTDGDVGARLQLGAEVIGEGRLCVQAARFAQVLRELAGEQVGLRASGDGCLVEAEGASYTITGESVDGFPELPDGDMEDSVALGAVDLSDMVRQTVFAAHAERTRYAMNGVLVDLQGTRLRLVATDGRRLALSERALAAPVERSVFVVAPTRSMKLLASLVEGGAGQIELSVDSTHLHVRTPTARIFARLVEGQFPPYEGLIAQIAGHDKHVKVDRDGLTKAIHRSAVLASSAKDTSGVRFVFGRGVLELSTRVADVGESRIMFPIDYTCEQVTTEFTPGYIEDGLKSLDDDEVLLSLRDTKAALVLRKVSRDASYIYMVMPMKIEEAA